MIWALRWAGFMSFDVALYDKHAAPGRQLVSFFANKDSLACAACLYCGKTVAKDRKNGGRRKTGGQGKRRDKTGLE